MAAPVNPHAKILYGPLHVGDQTIARVVRRPDGSGFVQTWKRGVGWVKGGAHLDEFIYRRPVSRQMAERQHFPLAQAEG